MKVSLVQALRCPRTGAPLRLQDAVVSDDEIESGVLATSHGDEYPIINHIPRFVEAENYASSFGLQWLSFQKTQLDSHSGVPISERRFYDYSGWKKEELRGKLILDVGCGAGRFTEIALAAGAHVVAMDYSDAVVACRTNHHGQPQLDVVQGDMRRPPFAPQSFDYVYCFGVLQHTPDPEAAFRALPRMLKPGGRLAIDIYPQLLLNYLWPKYWLRPLSRRLPADRLFRIVQKAVPILLPMSRSVGRVPRLGRKLRHAIPVINYEGIYPLSESQLEEWAILDTFDMLAPSHDHPQSMATVKRWFDEAGLREVQVARPGFIVGRGVAPAE